MYSITAIVTSFMAGLSIGSFVLGKYADKFENPLKIYGLVELLIAIYSVFFPQFVALSDSIIVKLFYLFAEHPDYLLAFRFLLCFFMLFFPTFLMGGTLPLLTRFLSFYLQDISFPMAILYFINTLGAAAGSLTAGFYLIPSSGLKGALGITVILTAFVGVIAFIFSLLLEYLKLLKVPAENAQTEQITDEPHTQEFGKIGFLLIAFITGFVSMNLEVAWMQLFSLLFGSTVYSFSLVLSGYLFGIAAGSLLFSCARKLGYVFKRIHLAFLLLLAAFLICYSSTLLPFVSYFILFIKRNINLNFNGQMYLFFITTVLCIGFPMLLLGISFPMLLSFYEKDLNFSGSSTGNLYGVNCIGSILGTFSFSFILLPTLGLKNNFLFCVFLFVLTSLILLKGLLNTRTILFYLGCLVLIFPPFFIQWNPNLLQAGIFRFHSRLSGKLPETPDRKQKILFHREEPQAIVSVFEVKVTGGKSKVLVINGKNDAGTSAILLDSLTMVNLGLFPLLSAQGEGPLSVLVIGLGCGMTVATLLEDKRVGKIDVIEISPAVLEAGSI
ncbi:hypothetical protein ACFL35_03860, partial [Candidatus Riflebacteria bacterium]